MEKTILDYHLTSCVTVLIRLAIFAVSTLIILGHIALILRLVFQKQKTKHQKVQISPIEYTDRQHDENTTTNHMSDGIK